MDGAGCPAGAPGDEIVCITGGNTCVECNVDGDCAGGEAGLDYCNNVNECVACTEASHCSSTPATPVCDSTNFVCVECNDDDDCPLSPGTDGECDEASNTCKECDGEDDDPCSDIQSCDLDTFTCGCDNSLCDPNIICDDAGACNTDVECRIDGDCRDGQTCSTSGVCECDTSGECLTFGTDNGGAECFDGECVLNSDTCTNAHTLDDCADDDQVCLPVGSAFKCFSNAIRCRSDAGTYISGTCPSGMDCPQVSTGDSSIFSPYCAPICNINVDFCENYNCPNGFTIQNTCIVN